MAKYSNAQRTAIIEAALQSIKTGQSLRAFCIANKLAYATAWEWLNPDGLVDNSPYARARDIGTHYLADECLEIADDLAAPRLPLDPALTGDADTLQAKVALAKLRIDTRLRLAGKWNQKDYGDKTTSEISGPGGAPIQMSAVTDRDRAKAMAALIMKAKKDPNV